MIGRKRVETKRRRGIPYVKKAGCYESDPVRSLTCSPHNPLASYLTDRYESGVDFPN